MEGRPPRGKAPRFGRRLAELRRQRGLTQARLATGLGLKPALVAYYERRAANPTLEIVKHVADFFEVPIGYFLDDDEPTDKPRGKRGAFSELEKRLERARHLPRREIKMAIAVLDGIIESYEMRKARRRTKRSAQHVPGHINSSASVSASK